MTDRIPASPEQATDLEARSSESASKALFSEDYYVVLETNQAEVILTQAELCHKLEQLFKEKPDLIPEDARSRSPETQIQFLLDTICELDLGPSQYLQWYAVRLEK